MLYLAGDKPDPAKVVGFGHGGSDGTGAWAFPAEDLIVCYFTQSRGNLTTIRIEATIQQARLSKSAPVAQVPEALKPYLGTYYANFAHYKNTPFEVRFRNGRLALDIPDQLAFELKEPGKDGRRQFAISDQIAITFQKDDAGKVIALTLFQGGATFEMPRSKPVLGLTKEAAAKYLGHFEREEDKVIVEILQQQDGTLAIRVPVAKTDLELMPRADKKTWELRQQPSVTIAFQEDAAGKVVTFTATSPDGKKLLRKRVEK